MRQISGLVTLTFLATATCVQAQSPNERIPAQRPIAGTVVDHRNQPVPGARLWWGGRNGYLELTTDQEGRFKAISPLEWKLLEGPGGLGVIWVEAEGSVLTKTSILGGDEQTRPELDLKVKLRILSPASPSRVRVVDLDGKPVAQARLEISKINGELPPPFRRFSGTTDDEGLFELDRMPPDGPSLRVTTDAAGTQEFRFFTYLEAPDIRILQLRPTGRLEGRIVGPAESRRGLQITVHSVEPPNSQQGVDQRLKLGVRPEFTVVTAELDDEGRFTIPAFIAGKIRIEVRPPSDADYLPQVPRELELVAGATTAVEIPMNRGIPVTGRVIDGLTNAPLPGVAVAVSCGVKTFARFETKTDRDGRFKAVALPGRGRPEITSGGSEEVGVYLTPPPVSLPAFEIRPDEVEKQLPEIRLTAARRIIGRVIAKEADVQMIRVTVDQQPQPGACDKDGYFMLLLPIDMEPKKFTVGSPFGVKGEARVVSRSPLVLEMPAFQSGF